MSSSIGITFVVSNEHIPIMPCGVQFVKPGKNSFFLKNGKTVISVENHKFYKFRMMKRTPLLNSSREI